MSKNPKPSPFWRKVIQAVEAQPLDISAIKGASGLEHLALCIGIDEARKRLIFISDDIDARAAVLVRGDVQAAFNSFHVIFARAIQVNHASAVLQSVEPVAFDQDALRDPEFLANIFKVGIEPLKRLRKFGVLAFESVDKIDFGIESFNKAILSKLPKYDEKRWLERNAVFLNLLREYDPLAEDIKYGVCPLPLYEFSEEQFESILEAQNVQAVQEVLRQHNILQYFFPSSDHLVLGLIDRGVSNKDALLTELKRVPKEGHPYGKAEITQPKALLRTIDQLLERGLIVEGGLEMEVSDKGATVRQTVKFKPREGLISKIINRFKIAIDLKNVFSIGQ